MTRRLLCTALTTLLLSPAAFATDGARVTIYHADGDALFSTATQGTVDSGHAIILEHRQLDLARGTQELAIDGLPLRVDPESISVTFAPSAGVSVLGQQTLAAHPLAQAIGKTVDVYTETGTAGASGDHLRGILLTWTKDEGVVLRAEDGTTHLIHRYISLTVPNGSSYNTSSLSVKTDAKTAGERDAQLVYMTTGLGWRAAYTATLADGNACSMQFKAEASIANRSGRDYAGANIKLVAGQVNLARSRPRMYAAAAPAPMAASMPEQAALGDYRSFTLAGAVSLPNGTVTLTPLYLPQTLACQREYLVEDGNAYTPPRPNTNDYGAQDYRDRAITSTLAFKAPDALPAGTVRAWTNDRDGAPALLGEGGIGDTPKGQEVSVQLGQSFDLRASRERTAFHVDAAAHTMTEAYRVTLTNGGDAARTVTLRQHPNRWREWTLGQSSIKPTKQTPQLLEFDVSVPAHGSATVDYTIQYRWAASDLH